MLRRYYAGMMLKSGAIDYVSQDTLMRLRHYAITECLFFFQRADYAHSRYASMHAGDTLLPYG